MIFIFRGSKKRGPFCGHFSDWLLNKTSKWSWSWSPVKFPSMQNKSAFEFLYICRFLLNVWKSVKTAIFWKKINSDFLCASTRGARVGPVHTDLARWGHRATRARICMRAGTRRRQSQTCTHRTMEKTEGWEEALLLAILYCVLTKTQKNP